MNKYTEFLNQNIEFLAAFSWSRYRILGAGLITLNIINNNIRLSWESFNKSKSIINRNMCLKTNFEKEILILFPDQVLIRATPTISPPEAFYRVGNQWQDFIYKKSKDFYW